MICSSENRDRFIRPVPSFGPDSKSPWRKTSGAGQSQGFYEKLGFKLVSDYGHYRILEDGAGWNIHLRLTPDWPANPELNPLGLYLYTPDVDAVAARMEGDLIGEGKPQQTRWGTYEFAVSDPIGTLVRVGRRV